MEPLQRQSEKTIVVKDLPVPAISGPATPCFNSSGNVYTTDAGMPSYTWSVPTGGTITSSTTGNMIIVTWNTAGPQTVSVNYTNTNNCTAATAKVYDVTVYPDLTAGISPGNSSICYNTSPGTFTATGGGGTGSYTYQWYNTISGIISGVTDPTYSPGNITSTTGYYCAITSGSCGTVNTPTTT
ncbi:MAG: hypothetical protein NT144_07895, partial [Bacteroidia bacterium]|nr:hypothetical protein [Bacteroidia bacterium]